MSLSTTSMEQAEARIVATDPPAPDTERTPLIRAAPWGESGGNYYSTSTSGVIPVNDQSIIDSHVQEGSTIWNEDRIDDALKPPDRTLRKGATSNLQTMTHIFKGNLGTGILAMPYAFSHAGLGAGFIGTAIIAVIAIHSVRMLVEASHYLCRLTGKETLDYGYCMDYAFKNVEGGGQKIKKAGRWMRKFVNLNLQITQFGFCCVYFVFMSDNIGQVINKHVYGHHKHGLSSRVYMACILPFMLAFCCIRSVRKLSYFSAVANGLMLTGIVIVYTQLLQNIPSINSVPLVNEDYKRWPIFLATTIYTFEGIGVILPLENKMKTPEALLPWNGVFNTAMIIVCCLYISMGFYGYLKFGSECEGSITLNLPPDNWLNEAVRVMLSLSMFVTYALMIFVPVEIIWPILKKRIKKEEWVKPLERVFRCFLVICTFCIAVAIPHLGPFISLIGAFASSSLALLFPSIIDTMVRWKSRLGLWYWRLWKNIIIFIFGFIGFFLGTITSIQDIIIAFQNDNSTILPTPSPTQNITLL